MGWLGDDWMWPILNFRTNVYGHEKRLGREPIIPRYLVNTMVFSGSFQKDRFERYLACDEKVCGIKSLA